MRDPVKGHAALRRGRTSVPHAEYFLTVCTDERRAGLTQPTVANAILAEMRAMDVDQTWRLRCAVVMPNHYHALVILGERLTLGQSVGRQKSKTAPGLRSNDPSLIWERDFYEHHVRQDEDDLSLFLYIFLNPYRARLCDRGDPWPWYYCREEDWAWFKGLLDTERPYPEWLRPQ